MGAGMLLGAGGAVLVVVLLTRMSPLLVATLVAGVGGLHAQGVIALPVPAVVADARGAVQVTQQRSVAALACRQALLQAADAADPVIARYC